MPWDNPIWTYRVRWRWWRRLPARRRLVFSVLGLVLGVITSRLVADRVLSARWSERYSDSWLADHDDLWPVAYAAFSVVTAIWATVACSAAIARERQRRTWDALLLTGLRPRTIILSKLASGLWPAYLVALWACPVWSAGLMPDVRHGPIVSPWLVAAWACWRSLGRLLPFGAVGLWISSRSSSAPRAVAAGVGVAALLAILPPLLAVPYYGSIASSGHALPEAPRVAALLAFLSWPAWPPVQIVGHPPFDWGIADYRYFDSRYGEVLFPGWYGFSVLADAFWIIIVPAVILGLMIRRFERLREGRTTHPSAGRRPAGRGE